MLEISQNCNLPQTKQTLISEVWPWLKMPPVSIPQEAGCSSAGPSTSTLDNPIKIPTAQPAWPEQIQAKITQLEKVGIGIQNRNMRDLRVLHVVFRNLKGKRSQRNVSGERS